MISYKEALEILKNNIVDFGTEEVPIKDAVGLIAAENLTSKITVPSFNNAAMDGFALNSNDVKNASKTQPVKLEILSTIEAGDDLSIAESNLSCVEIMTGARMPDNYDAVIMVEKANIIDGHLIIDEPIPIKNNVRLIGEDFAKEDKIINKGEKINPNHIMALLTAGNSVIKIQNQPKVAIIATGKELVDSYNSPLEESQIYNSNSPYIISYLKNLGFDAKYFGIIADKQEDFHELMDRIEGDNYDIVISTGAVSMGKKDFIKEALLKRQIEILFHKVKIRPGKPILFAKSKINKLRYFGLPGNPISSLVGLDFFVKPFIQNCLKLKTPKTITAILKNSPKAKAGLLHFLKSYSYIENGKIIVEILNGQESFKTKPLIKTNSLAIIDGDKNYNIDDIVEISLLTSF